MRKFTLAMAMTATLAFAHSAVANTVNPSNDTAWNHHPDSWYTELNLGTNLYYLAVLSSDRNTADNGFQGFGWSASVGYQFGGNWGVEAGFMQNYAKFENEDNDFVDTHTNIPFLVARYTLPIGQRASFILKLGAMYASLAAGFDNTDNVTSPSIILPMDGIGFGYAITPNLDATVQYQGLVVGFAGAGLFSAGLTYHFV